jgi:HEAT repeat protein
MGRTRKAWRRPLDASARALVDSAVEFALMDPLPGFGRGDRLRAVRRAFELNLPATLPRLAPLAFAPDPEVAAFAQTAVPGLLGLMHSWEYVALDRGLRHPDSHLDRLVTASKLDALVRRTESRALLLGLATCHPNGYVRATAMRSANQWDVELPLYFALLRLDDWVLPIRRLARRRILDRVGLDHVPDLIPALPLMELLAGRRRVQRGKALRWIEQLLRDPEARSVLWTGLDSPEPAVRRSSISLLIEASDIDLVRMLDVARDPHDPWTAGRAADAILATGAGVPDELRTSPDAGVRARALAAAAELPSVESLAALQAGLMDPNRAVREVAVFHLHKGGAIRIGAMYRAHLGTARGRTLRTALCGVGEVGDDQDIPLLLPFLAPGRPSMIARAALAAIARLDRSGRLDLLIDHLDDPRPGVSRTAADALGKSPRVPPRDRLWGLVSSAHHTHGSRNAFRVLARGPRWARAPHLLLGANSADPWIAQHALCGLEAWCHQIPPAVPPPSSADSQAVEAALRGRGRGVPERIAVTIRRVMEAARA